MIQYPAISSLDSVKGPSTTVRFPPENLTRAPFELACSPAASSSTPAFISSSLYLPIAESNSSLGITPASESLLAFTIIMNRIVLSPLDWARTWASIRPLPPKFCLHPNVEPDPSKSTYHHRYFLALAIGTSRNPSPWRSADLATRVLLANMADFSST